MKKTVWNTVGRVVLWALAIVIQVCWIIFAVYFLQNRFPIVETAISILSIVAVFWLVSRDMNPSYKLAWTILILAVPIAGAVIYFLFGRSWLGADVTRKLDESEKVSKHFLSEEEESREHLRRISRGAERQSEYICYYAGFPLYEHTQTRYFPTGEALYPVLLEELQKAEHFIFMEYFIIDDGEMWQSILAILEEKARNGVDVRVIYDDWGCSSKMPQSFENQLREKGISCQVFNPLKPIASVIYNNRDHRKITVIDGHTAFTGGVNLADEYINKIERFGYWKDSALMLYGEGTWSFTVMFLRMWSSLAGTQASYGEYRPHRWHSGPFEGTGFVQPYADSPLDSETVGENVYLNIINRAKNYVYIFTPYLIIDNEMKTALTLAARSGIDVRIVVPGIPDKKYVFTLSQSYYETLLRNGVRIYEYTPGFLHAKSFISDDSIGVVSTINLDYRSLYLHFECGVWMYGTDAVGELKKDTEEVFAQSREITLADCGKSRFPKRLWQSILRLFAPLM